VQPYAWVKEANKKGQIFLYDWQKPLLQQVLSFEQVDPRMVLYRRLKAKTTSENEFLDKIKQNQEIDNLELSASEVLAQYEYLDNEYYQYQKYSEGHFPEMVPMAIKARKTIHAAARNLLLPMLVEREMLPKNEKEKLIIDLIKQGLESIDQNKHNSSILDEKSTEIHQLFVREYFNKISSEFKNNEYFK
jgi:hypothetical protein